MVVSDGLGNRSVVIAGVALQDSGYGLEFFEVPLLEHPKSSVILVADDLQGLYSSEHLGHSRLEGLVLLVDLPELLLPVVLYYVVHVDLRGLEEGLRFLGVGVHAHLHLLALQLHLLRPSVRHLLLFGGRSRGLGLGGVLGYAQFLVAFPAHLLEQFFLVLLVFGLLDAVELCLSFLGLFLEDLLGGSRFLA